MKAGLGISIKDYPQQFGEVLLSASRKVIEFITQDLENGQCTGTVRELAAGDGYATGKGRLGARANIKTLP